MSTKPDQQDEKTEGFWSLRVGKREASLKALENAIADAGGNPAACLRRLDTDDAFARRIGEQMALDVAPSTPSDLEWARGILGDDFIGPDEIAKARGVQYCASQRQQLLASVPSDDVLRSLKKQSYALVAGPPEPMSLLDVRDVSPSLFCPESGGWYSKDKQRFAHEETVGCAWIAIRKKIVPDSTSKTWSEQNDLLGTDETVPNGAAFAWFVTTYYAVRGTYLFGGVYARVRSVSAYGGRVGLGYFGRGGLVVNLFWDGRRSGAIGLAASRKV